MLQLIFYCKTYLVVMSHCCIYEDNHNRAICVRTVISSNFTTKKKKNKGKRITTHILNITTHIWYQILFYIYILFHFEFRFFFSRGGGLLIHRPILVYKRVITEMLWNFLYYLPCKWKYCKYQLSLQDIFLNTLVVNFWWFYLFSK